MVERVFHRLARAVITHRAVGSGIMFCPECIVLSPCEINTEMEKQSE